nr:hypothetical protein DLTAUQXX_DLTAUQXX_CDS_0042 [uncultured phage]CAI9750133.1 hypothetical protein LUIDIZRK_LUIDIZRK_CDS_0042 [uncultured phage]
MVQFGIAFSQGGVLGVFHRFDSVDNGRLYRSTACRDKWFSIDRLRNSVRIWCAFGGDKGY